MSNIIPLIPAPVRPNKYYTYGLVHMDHETLKAWEELNNDIVPFIGKIPDLYHWNLRAKNS